MTIIPKNTYNDLSEMTEAAFTALRDATVNECEDTTRLTAASAELEAAKEAIIVKYADEAKILGSNEAARKAKINELCSDYVNAVQEAEFKLAKSRHATALAKLEHDRVRQFVRIAAISQGVSIA